MLRFGKKIDALGITDNDARLALNALLEDFENKLGKQSSGAMTYLSERLYAREEPDIDHPTVGISIPIWEMDFTQGEPVYSFTPRLLLKVPETRRNECSHVIEQAEEGPSQHTEKLGWGGAPLPKDAVLIYPNQEGEQENVEERPVVQWSGVKPDDIVIIGRITPEAEPKITAIIENVIGQAPEGQPIWLHYEEAATIDDLADILTGLRKAGFSNQYQTTSKYLESANALTAGATSSGLFERDSDRERCSSIYIPGEIKLGYNPSEEITGGGFAVIILSKNGKEYRPVSSDFMEKNYRYNRTKTPVVPSSNQILFKDWHPLQNVETEFEELLTKIAELNKNIRKTHAIKPDGTAQTGTIDTRSPTPKNHERNR